MGVKRKCNKTMRANDDHAAYNYVSYDITTATEYCDDDSGFMWGKREPPQRNHYNRRNSRNT